MKYRYLKIGLMFLFLTTSIVTGVMSIVTSGVFHKNVDNLIQPRLTSSEAADILSSKMEVDPNKFAHLLLKKINRQIKTLKISYNKNMVVINIKYDRKTYQWFYKIEINL
ncbi:hypothetical protein [[Acholeplasma] multilocale]|uniref:hypothetical protein n=1 Tax=[Acholeplasma] multilocale TaxID=264638 RepID=UPI000478D010|nr:hypothetical protein [[Acholeplasma] multilocale]